MTIFGGLADFTITDVGGVVRDLSTYISSISGLPGEGTVEDVTTLGAPNRAKMWARSLNDAKISLKLFWDPTATTGPDAVLSPLRTATAPVTFTYSPSGTATGNKYYTGLCLVEKVDITSEASKYTTASVDIQTTGGVTESTH